MLKSYLENIKKDIKSGEIDANKILWMANGTGGAREVERQESKKEIELLSFLDRLLPINKKEEMKKFFYNFFIIFENSLYTDQEDIDTVEAEKQRSEDIEQYMSISYTIIKNYLLKIIDEAIEREEEKQIDEDKWEDILDRVNDSFFIDC